MYNYKNYILTIYNSQQIPKGIYKKILRILYENYIGINVACDRIMIYNVV